HPSPSTAPTMNVLPWDPCSPIQIFHPDGAAAGFGPGTMEIVDCARAAPAKGTRIVSATMQAVLDDGRSSTLTLVCLSAVEIRLHPWAFSLRKKQKKLHERLTDCTSGIPCVALRQFPLRWPAFVGGGTAPRQRAGN